MFENKVLLKALLAGVKILHFHSVVHEQSNQICRFLSAVLFCTSKGPSPPTKIILKTRTGYLL